MLNEKFTQILLMILATAFLAWAGVVYRAAESASSMLSTFDVWLDSLEAQVTRVEVNHNTHEALIGHPGVLATTGRNSAEIESLRRDIERLQNRIR